MERISSAASKSDIVSTEHPPPGNVFRCTSSCMLTTAATLQHRHGEVFDFVLRLLWYVLELPQMQHFQLHNMGRFHSVCLDNAVSESTTVGMQQPYPFDRSCIPCIAGLCDYSTTRYNLCCKEPQDGVCLEMAQEVQVVLLMGSVCQEANGCKAVNEAGSLEDEAVD